MRRPNYFPSQRRLRPPELDLELNLLNQQSGATYDLGAGTDLLHLIGNTGFGNLVGVKNVENVDSVGTGSDAIHILGNAGGDNDSYCRKRSRYGLG